MISSGTIRIQSGGDGPFESLFRNGRKSILLVEKLDRENGSATLMMAGKRFQARFLGVDLIPGKRYRVSIENKGKGSPILHILSETILLAGNHPASLLPLNVRTAFIGFLNKKGKYSSGKDSDRLQDGLQKQPATNPDSEISEQSALLEKMLTEMKVTNGKLSYQIFLSEDERDAKNRAWSMEGSLEEKPSSFFLKTEVEDVGEVGFCFFARDATFTPLTLFIAVDPDKLQKIREMSEGWEIFFRDNDVKIDGIMISARSEYAREANSSSYFDVSG